MLAPAPHIETLTLRDGRIIRFYWENARMVLLQMDPRTKNGGKHVAK
jgi:hypothetical protein